VPKEFGAKLKELRMAAGWTQAQLAEKANISQRAVSHWEQGLREPSWSNVLALADALGVRLQGVREERDDTPGEAPPAKGRAEEEEEGLTLRTAPAVPAGAPVPSCGRPRPY